MCYKILPMAKVAFITGNPRKAEFLKKYLGYPVDDYLMELDEVHSLDYRKIVQQKALQAFYELRNPVLVENVGLSFTVVGQRLPGTLIKWLLEAWGYDGLCQRLGEFEDRSAQAEICFAFFDGRNLKFFEGNINGQIPDAPRGNGHLAFGWNPIFIPEGSSKTYAEMDEIEAQKFSLHRSTVYPQIKQFLESLEKDEK